MVNSFNKITLGQQIADFLREKITRNEFKDGMLPKEEELAVQLKVSRGTVRSAMAILEAEDLILRVKKRGTMIRGYSMQYPDLRRVKRLNLFYHGSSADFFSIQAQGFYSYIFNSILAEASKRQYILNVGLIETGALEKATLKKCLDLEAEGNILLAITGDDIVKSILETNQPTVLVDHAFKDFKIDTVNVDSYKGSYDAVKYLYQKGHRKILYVNHYRDSANPDRTNGVRDAIRDLKIGPKNYFEIKSEPKPDLAYMQYQKVKHDFPPVTAIITFGPEMAAGFIKGLEESGKRIPEDYSIISSGNIGERGMKINTVEFDLNQLGKVAVSRLVDLIKGGERGKYDEKIPGFIADRGSVADISKQ